MVISISFLWDMVSSSFRQNSLWSFLCEIPRADRCSRFWRQERLQKELDEEKRSSWILAPKFFVAGYWQLVVWYTHIYQNFVLCKPGVLQKEGGNTEWQHTSPKAQSEQMNCAARTHVSMERMMWKRHEAWIHENVEWRTTRMENFARKSIKHPVCRVYAESFNSFLPYSGDSLPAPSSATVDRMGELDSKVQTWKRLIQNQ
jgi:hypothetical protein